MTTSVKFPLQPRATNRLTTFRKHPLEWALIASLLLHLLAFALSGVSLKSLALLQAATAEPKTESPPIVFEIAETPESARRPEPPPDAKRPSDKNAVAQNPVAPENLPTDEAYSEGALAHLDRLPVPAAEPVRETQPELAVGESQEQSSASPTQTYSFGAPNFRREFLTGQKPQASTQSVLEQSPGRNNISARAPELGSFSLNTYEWDFAPYLLWLKKRVQGNIYPPPAFTHMGLISGQTLLRFRIYPDGTLHNLELMRYNGHKTLMETSVRAVELSVPFRKLPENFPEPYLEITAQFDYILLRHQSPEE